MNFLKPGVLALLGLFAFSPAQAAETKAMTGYDLAVLMDGVDTSKDSVSLGHMEIKRGSQTLVRDFETYTDESNKDVEERNLFVFNSPAEVKGTKYLEWTYRGTDKDDDLWVYLPSESLVRRISGSSKFASFMRSDYTNEDIENMDDVEDYTYNLKGSEVVGGIDCYILERYPKPEKKTQYSKHKQWVRKDNYLRLKMEYYDKHEKLVKTMYFSDCRKIDGIWTNMHVRLERADGGSVTTVLWKEVKYNVGLDPELFTQSQLQR